jgi:Flp pilus assembly protein TadG
MKMNIDRRGLAGLEFALVAPVLILLALGTYDLVGATTTWWHLAEAAQAVGQIATSSAAQVNETNSLTKTQAYAASTAIYPLVPELTSGTAKIFGVVLTSVVFTPTVGGCTSGCTYTAAAAWSHSLVGTATLRACGALVLASDGAAPSAATLPADVFTSAPLLVVDIYYTYQPLFTMFVAVPIPMIRTAYLPMRTGADAQWMRYVDPTSAQPMCPGFT